MTDEPEGLARELGSGSALILASHLKFGTSLEDLFERTGIGMHELTSRLKNREFREAFQAEMGVAMPVLEAEAQRRAFSGSDKLLMFLLKAYDPERFGEKKTLRVEDAGSDILEARKRVGIAIADEEA